MRLATIYDKLSRPNAAITRDNDRRSARLLSVLVFFTFLFAVTGSLLSPVAQERFIVALIALAMVAAYWLSRSRFYIAGGVLAVVALQSGSYALLLLETVHDMFHIMTWSSWLSMGILLSSLWLPLAYVITLWLLNVIVLAVIPTLVPGISYDMVPSAIMQIALFGALIVLAARIRLFDAMQIEEKNHALQEQVLERTRIAEQLELARNQAEQANISKSRFLASMSHELRTPLNSVIGYGQLLGDVLKRNPIPQAPLLNDYSHSIVEAGQHLLHLINGILDLSAIESGRIALSLEPVDVAAVIEESTNLVAPLLTRFQVQMKSTSLPSLPAVTADRIRLRQVLVNLLNNAIKYNRPGGKVWLIVQEIAGDVKISVCDDGRGIAPEHQPLLFQPFSRLGAENTEIEGAGIGLSIVKSLVELQKGRIGFNSDPGKGSCFWLVLPACERHEGTAAPLPQESVQLDEMLLAGKVLYIEDNESNISLMEAIFEIYPNLSLAVASTGTQGLEMAASEAYDLILLDINLPDIDGYDVYQRLRGAGITTSVVALSADARAIAREKGMALGLDDYLFKPISVEQLLQVLQRYLSVP